MASTGERYLNQDLISKNSVSVKQYSEEEQLNLSIETLKQLGYSEHEIEVMFKEIEEIENNSVSFDSEKATKDGVDKNLVARTEADIEKIEGNARLFYNCPGYNTINFSLSIIFFDNCVTNITYAISTGATAVSLVGVMLAYLKPKTPGYGTALAVAGLLINQGAMKIQWKNRGYGIAVFYGRSPIEYYGQ
ncbi:hypothetical protein CUC15_10370 [Oceanobacillus zhaokaii]|uniref:Uncharacterized protein n=1 Tax=Oceanobacillus zhaokaii TaxID=2052660 RepID=A0A345PH21_9BACI|nr:hypothetical protein CUC15_10370 [Oceanobacillus zhaokaii]